MQHSDRATIIASFWVHRIRPLLMTGVLFLAFGMTAAQACSISPTSTSHDSTAYVGYFNVQSSGFTDLACQAWTASSNDSWIHVVDWTAGGTGTVTFSVDANSGGARSGTIKVSGPILAGMTFTINQGSGIVLCHAPSLSPTSQSFTAAAGNSFFSVTANCAWTAVSNASWIHVTSGASGTGFGTVFYSVDANAGGARSGTIAVGGVTYTVTQSSGSISVNPCLLLPSYAITPTSRSAAAAGDTGTVSVTDSSSCGWTAVSNASWIHVTSGASGTGNGTVGYSVDANAGSARSGTLTIAGKTFTVTQSAVFVFCLSPSIAPTSQEFTANGGGGSVAVTFNAGCTWTAVSNNPACITSVSPASGSGNGTVNYSVARNGGTVPGVCTMTIAGQTFTVLLDGCTFSLGPTSAAVGAAAGSGSVALTASGSSCAWSTTSNVSWITVTSGASGSGSGSIGYSFAANSGGARSGTISIGGQTFTLSQSAASGPTCTFSLGAASAGATTAAGSGSVALTASAASCAWTATSNASWITVTSGGSGAGSSNIGYSFSANSGSPRSGTISIGTQTFTVNQDGPPAAACTFSLSSAGAAVSAAAGSGSAALTASAASCAWTATSNASWITVTSGASGTGSSSIGYSYSANSSGPRTGTISIGSQTFTVSQAGVPGQAATLGATVSVIKSGTIGANTYGEISVSCPSGMVALSGGIDLYDWLNMRVTTSAPTFGVTPLFNTANGNNPAPDGWYASGRNDTTSPQWATVGVVCSSLAGVSTVVTSNGVAASDWNDMLALCPAGTIATGGGVDNFDPFTMVVASHSPYYSSSSSYLLFQNDGVNSAPIGWYGASHQLGTTTQTMKVAAICAPLSGANSIVGSASVAAGDWDGSLASCPSGTTAVGGGVDVENFLTMAAASDEPYYSATPPGMWQRDDGQYEAPTSWVGVVRNADTVSKFMKTAAICAPSGATIIPTSNFYPAAGGGGQVAVTASSAWTAVSNVSWLSIVPPLAAGSGNGAVFFNVAVNSGAQRVGTMTIGGQTFTVTQMSPPPATATVQIIEYRNSAQDDYFITADPAEQAQLDAAALIGAVWSRTGMSFKSGGNSSVYRFIYRSSTGTNTHFYTVNTSEYSSLLANYPIWVLESPVAFYMTTANANLSCPPGTVAVYRAANLQTGSHRFTTIQSAITEVLNRGWTNEGVAFCAPQ